MKVGFQVATFLARLWKYQCKDGKCVPACRRPGQPDLVSPPPLFRNSFEPEISIATSTT